MLVKIKCPKCATDGSFSLADEVYEGPYRCWKCRQPFAIKMKKDQLESIEAISQEECDRLMEIHALRTKFRKQ